QEAGTAGVYPTWHVGVWVVPAVQAPPVRGHLGDPIATGEQEVPELVWPMYVPRKSAADSYDCHTCHIVSPQLRKHGLANIFRLRTRTYHDSAVVHSTIVSETFSSRRFSLSRAGKFLRVPAHSNSLSITQCGRQICGGLNDLTCRDGNGAARHL